MKKTIQIILLLVLGSNVLKGQNLIAVQNGGNPTFYVEVNDAVANAQNGDTIYIPGGTWTVLFTVNKELHIIGAGYNTDSTTATFPTTLNGTINLAAGASNGSLAGLFLNGNFDQGNGAVNTFLIIRCHISNRLILHGFDSNFVFCENIIDGDLWGSSSTNCSFLNNIIVCYFHTPFVNSMFKNNIIYGSQINNGYCLFENNIFEYYNGPYNSVFKNNIFADNFSFPSGTNVGFNNIFNQPFANTFVSQSFYHLAATSPGKNAGTDGTDIGIYGGSHPWKEGAMPNNPHITYSNIGDETNSSGALPVNIRVEAQGY